MIEADIITGSCHCGAVRFEVSWPDWVISCSCSICRRNAALWAHCPPNEGRILAGADAARGRLWGDRTIAFRFCETCGGHDVATDATRLSLDLRLADDPHLLTGLRVRHFDGAENWVFPD